MTVDSDQTTEGYGAEAANMCMYNGQAYSSGAIVCMDGYEYSCSTEGSWENTGHRCQSGGAPDAGTGGSDDGGSANA